MTLSDAQAQILRAMREGAELEYMNGYPPLSPPAIFVAGKEHPLKAFAGLTTSEFIGYVDGHIGLYRTYTLTPAGAEALAAWEAGR